MRIPLFRTTCWILPLLVLAACGGRGSRGGGGADDDDSASGDDDTTPSGDDDDTPSGDDDDTTPPGDDDTTPPGDDDTTPSGGACNGSLTTFSELEPNDDETGPDIVGGIDGALRITGQLTGCGNDGSAWTGNNDFFLVTLECDGGMADVEVTWSGSSNDVDFLVADSTGTTAFFTGYGVATTGPEAASGSITDTEFLIAVLCWEGPNVNYTLDLTW